MKKSFFAVISIFFICCHNNNNIPDVSGIHIDVHVKRFEKDFFALDTNHLYEGLQKLQSAYPDFSNDFIDRILGLNTYGLMHSDVGQATALKSFLKDYRPLKDSVDRVFENFEKYADELVTSLKLLKYYFPGYKTPQSIITFIGPIDAFFQTSFGTQGDIITRDGLGVGLQLHMGSNFSYYLSSQGLDLYPRYISRTFAPDYIPVNCMKNIIDDMFEEKSTAGPLVEQMVEKGKRLYLLDKLLPNTPDHLKIAYTEDQMKNAYKNEAVIWDFFLSNDLLNNTEQNITKNYIGESPKTQEFGDDAPGNIGSFAGWQIVKKYSDLNPEITPGALMKMDPREIYRLSKYKPKA